MWRHENMFDKKILFISHAEKDSDLVEKFVNLLYDIGISKNRYFAVPFQN